MSAVPQQIPDLLRARLCRLAARIALGHRSESVTESIALACDLIGADVAPRQVVWACLSPDEIWRDPGAPILEMFASLGAEVPQAEDESAAWPVVLRAFGFCDLPSERLEVTANPHALGFYRACGFTDCGLAETEFGTAPRMVLSMS